MVLSHILLHCAGCGALVLDAALPGSRTFIFVCGGAAGHLPMKVSTTTLRPLIPV